VSGVRGLPTALSEKGRTIFVPHSDLIGVEPAVLDLPRALPVAVVMPPLFPFPMVPWYPNFRVESFPLVTGGPVEVEDDPFAGDDDDEGDDETASEFEERVMRERQKWEFVESEWDFLTLETGGKWFGRISLKKAQRAQGYKKYDLLLPENRGLLFYFEKLNKLKGTIEGTGENTLDGSGIAEVGFKDTIEDRYWSRRTTQRVDPKNHLHLQELVRWLLPVCEQEGYDRKLGLELAVKTAEEALAARPGDLESTLLLGEALHLSFAYDKEFELYEKELAVKPASALHARIGRIYRKLGLIGMEETELTKALELAPGDSRTRLSRGEARFKLGNYTGADEDFAEAVGGGSAEEQTAGKEGQARVLLVQGHPARAAGLLAGSSDLASLVTLGAARYAQRDFAAAKEAFERVVDEEPEFTSAVTNLGFAQVQTAETWADLDEAVKTLDKARELNPLNYFYPPLGKGFAESRRGRTVESVDRFAAAAAALPTDPYIHYILGVSYLRDQRFEDARDEFKAALSLDFRFLDALIGAGVASMGVRVPPPEGSEATDVLMAWSDARDYLERALEIERRRFAENRTGTGRADLVVAQYRYGRAILASLDLAQETRLRMAEAQFRAILETDDRHVPSLNALGFILYGNRDVEGALRAFDQARSLSPKDEEDVDRAYAIEMKQRILDAESRRLWRELFDRRDNTAPANGWVSEPHKGIRWRLMGGKAVTKGRWPQEGTLWLTRGDNRLNGSFIGTRAVVEIPEDAQQTWRFMVFTRRGTSVGAAVGVERNTRGEVVFLTKRAGDPDFGGEVVEDENGMPVMWPAGPVTAHIERTDPEKGIFEVSFEGRKIGKIDLGIKRRPGPLELGFSLSATSGEEVEAAIEEVEIELYVR
jgi:tetratricopeptide (TPR) repeat protein